MKAAIGRAAPAPVAWRPLVALTLIALLVRLPLLSLGLWRDEASTYIDVLPARIGDVVARVASSEQNPPGFFVFMHAWTCLFGFAEVALKSPSLLFGVLAVPAAYALGSVTGGRLVALLAAGSVAFSPELVYYSQEARPYSLAVLLSTLAVFAFWRATTTGRWDVIALWVVIASALIYVQYTGLVVLLGLALATVYLVLMRQPVPAGRLVFGFGAVALLFSPWLPSFVRQLHAGLPWVSGVSRIERPAEALRTLAYAVPIQFWFDQVLLQRIAGLIVFAVLCAAGWALHQRLRDARGKVDMHDIALAMVGICTVTGAAVEAWFSYGAGRYVLAFVPLACVLYAGVLARAIRGRTWLSAERWTAILVGVSAIVVDLATIESVSAQTSKSGIREIASNAAVTPDARTAYLAAPDYVAPTFAYYIRPRTTPVHGLATWSHPEIFPVQGAEEAWRRPDLVSTTLRSIERLRQEGYRRLVVIRGETTKRLITDQGTMRFSRTEDVLRSLGRQYALIASTEAAGRTESVTMEVFDLTSRPRARR